MIQNIPADIDPDDSFSDLIRACRSDGRPTILFAGGVIFTDRVEYLDLLAKQMPRFRFVIMCENLRNRKNVHNKFKEYKDAHPESRVEYFPVPNRMMRDNHEKNAPKSVSEGDAHLISSKAYLSGSAENLRRRYDNMGDGYPEYLVAWMHAYLSDVLDRMSPSAVIIWNKFHAMNRILDELCRERAIKTLYMEYGVLPGTFCLEMDGQMGESYPSRDPEGFSGLPVGQESLNDASNIWNFLYESRLNRKSQPKKRGIGDVNDFLALNHKTVLFLGVNDYESGICPYTDDSRRNHSPVFEGSDQCASFLAGIARRNGWNFIYKPHPIIAGDMQTHRRDDGAIVASDVDINDLIDEADVVVTILSQAGYISTIRRKATLMLGYTQLRGKGITYEAFSLEEVEPALSEALEKGFTDEMASAFQKHVAQLSEYYLLDDQSKKRMAIGMSYKQCVKFLECATNGKSQAQAMVQANSVGRYVGNSISVDRSIREIKQFSETVSRPVVLVVGHVCFDDETDYLYQMAKRMRDYRIVDITLHYRARYDRVYNPDYVTYRHTAADDLRMIKFFVAPELFTKDRYPKNFDMEVTAEMRGLLESEECVRIAAQNLRMRHRDMGEGYPENFACEAYRYVGEVLDALKPKVVLMWNKFHAFSVILDRVCKQKGVRTLYMEFGSLPGTYSIEPMGQMGESAVARFAQDFMDLKVDEADLEGAEKILKHLRDSNLSRRKQPVTDLSELEGRISNGRPTILYAGQNDYESGLVPYTEDSRRFHSPSFCSSRDALDFLAGLAGRKGWNLVYKAHPIMSRYSAETDYPENVIVADADINRLIDMCDVTTTILSQVSYVSLIREKPVVMLGYTQLKGKGCTYEAFDRESAEGAFGRAIADGYTAEQRRMFVRHTAQIVRYYLLDDTDGDKGVSYPNGVSMAVSQVLLAVNGYGNQFLPPDKSYIGIVSERSGKELVQGQDIVEVIGRNPVKVVSFDVFDTLLERPVVEPAHVFRLVERRLGLGYDFPKYREMAQRMAGQSKPAGNDSVTLDEIYAQLAKLTNDSAENIARIKEEELAVEADYLRPRPLGRMLYDAASKAGKTIVITTDMYLPEEFIASVLEKNGFGGYSRLFVSCESMKSKKTGRLYDHVVDSLGRRSFRAQDILHIGDNIASDFNMAREHGYMAIHVPRAVDLLKKVAPLSTLYKYIDKNMDNSFLVGTLANRVFADPFISYDRQSSFNGKPGNMAALVYAPILSMFMKWMMDDLSRDRKDVVYFLSRDGYMPGKVYEMFRRFYDGLPDGEEMYLNRSLMYATCSYSPNGIVDADMKYPPSPKMHVEDYVRYRLYARDEKQFKEISKVLADYGYGPDDEVRRLLSDYDARMAVNGYFVENLRPRADALRAYFREKLDSRDAAIFDVGYRGRACRFLDDEMGYKVTEYHIISRPEVKSYVPLGYDVRSFMDLSNLTIDRAEIAFILLDTVLSVQEPGIRSIEPTADGYAWEHEREDVFTDTIRDIQEEMMDVVAEIADVCSPDWRRLRFDPFPFVDLMTESLSKPSPKDAQMFRNQNTPNEPAFVDMSRKGNISRWVSASSKARAPEAEGPARAEAAAEREQLPSESVAKALVSMLDRMHLTNLCKKLYAQFGQRVFKKR